MGRSVQPGWTTGGHGRQLRQRDGLRHRHPQGGDGVDTGGGQVNTAVFSPDGSEVLTSGDDGNGPYLEPRRTEPIGPPSARSTSLLTAVNSAVFGTFDENDVVISASNDGIVRALSAEAATPTCMTWRGRRACE